MDFQSAFNFVCGGPGYWHGSGWMSSLPFHFGGFFSILLFGALIFFLLRTLRTSVRDDVVPASEEVLKRRYAAGEIDRDTYRRMMDEIQ